MKKKHLAIFVGFSLVVGLGPALVAYCVALCLIAATYLAIDDE